jgi:hypothetical protein
MLAKCANASCSEFFRYLESGRLFRLDTDGAGPSATPPEYFWLCHRCSRKMTLRLDESNGIKVVHSRETALRRGDSLGLVLLDRQRGLLLKGVDLTGFRPRRERTLQRGQVRI